MCRGTYHSVVKCKTETVSARQMCVYHVAVKCVCVAKSREERLRLTCNIVLCSYRNNSLKSECIKLLIIAKHRATLGILCVAQEINYTVLISVKKNQGRRRGVMSVFHTG